MQEESKQALSANDKLREELEIQSTGITAMMKKFDKQKEVYQIEKRKHLCMIRE